VHRVVVADPPWKFSDSLPGPKRGAASHYGVLKTPDIVRFLETDVKAKIAADAILFMWCVPAMAPAAYEVVRGWGFTPKSELIWVKTARAGGDGLHFGMGRYVRMAHERCIIATRGKALDLVGDHSTRSVFFAPVGGHSVKPDAFYDLVEKLTPGGPFLELFARRKREGWTTLGNEVEGEGAARPLLEDAGGI